MRVRSVSRSLDPFYACPLHESVRVKVNKLLQPFMQPPPGAPVSPAALGGSKPAAGAAALSPKGPAPPDKARSPRAEQPGVSPRRDGDERFKEQAPSPQPPVGVPSASAPGATATLSSAGSEQGRKSLRESGGLAADFDAPPPVSEGVSRASMATNSVSAGTKRPASELDNEPLSKRRRIVYNPSEVDELGDDWLARPLLGPASSSTATATATSATSATASTTDASASNSAGDTLGRRKAIKGARTSPGEMSIDTFEQLDDAGKGSGRATFGFESDLSSGMEVADSTTQGDRLDGLSEGAEAMEQQHIEEENEEISTTPQALQARIAQLKGVTAGPEDQAILAIQTLLGSYCVQFVRALSPSLARVCAIRCGSRLALRLCRTNERAVRPTVALHEPTY